MEAENINLGGPVITNITWLFRFFFLYSELFDDNMDC
jgi:hypothetical protein